MIDDLAAVLQFDPARKRALLAQLMRARPAPLSFAQRRLWLLDQIEPGAATYNVASAFRLGGPLDIGALDRALNEIVRRHDVLRSVITVEAGEPAMRTVEDFTLALGRCDLIPPATLESIVAAESKRGFALQAEPAIRALLVRVGAGDHVLIVTIHHIITDGWSMAIFNRELSALYGAYVAGLASPLAPLHCRFADFARAERERVSGDHLARALAYWKDQLRDAPPFIEFAGRRDTVRAAPDSGMRSRLLGGAARDALAGLAAAQHATLGSVLLSLWSIVLYRSTGQADVTIGAVISNRARAAFEDLIGFFVNTLPLRARIDGAQPFSALVAQVQSTTLDAFEHIDTPLDRIIEESSAARTALRTPFLDVLFVFQNAPDAALVLAGLDVRRQPVPNGPAKADLVLQITESTAELSLTLEYRAELFSAADIDAMLAAFATLAEAVVRQPNCAVAELPVLDAAERERQIGADSRAIRRRPAGRIEELFEWQAECGGERIALVCADESLSYRALNERANRLALHLRSIGVRRGDAVAVVLERGIGAVVAFIAILKAHGVYVPLDPAYPRERLELMIADTAARVVLTQRRHAGGLRGLAPVTVAVDDDAAWRRAPAQNAGAAGSAGDAAYVMYTSGSTGAPKGVLVSHGAIEHLVIEAGYFTIGRADAIAQVSTLAFDASTFEIWGALLNGARLIIVPTPVLLAPDSLAAFIATSGISIMLLTTALFHEIVRKNPATFGDLRVLIVGGEKLESESVALLRADRPPAALINAYGPTEATTFAAAFAVDLNAGVPADIPIGGPIGQTELLVLDARLQLLPRGACGQLFIGGPGLALGYLGKPELTAAKFIPHPLRDDPAARLYATGDLVRYDGESLVYVGRVDAQIKRRGFRIEPGEIETALRACRGVSDAAVLPQTDPAGNVRLVGYVTSEAPAGVDRDALMTALRARLPAHLVPDAIVPLPSFPLTTSGKLDRRALLALPVRAEHAALAAPVVSELQQQLVRLWETLLGIAPVGIRENFFALGGHSLLAIRLVSEIERLFGIRLPLATLFEQPTIEHLADVLRCDPANLNRSPIVALNAGGSAQAFFFLHGSIGGGGFYCLPLAERLGIDRPLFAMRPHGVDGGAIPPTIEAIATECIGALKSVRPAGPYLLGGFCSGGMVAFEMARQLVAGGDVVDNVVLVEPPHAGALPGAAGEWFGVKLGARLSRLAHVFGRRAAVAKGRGFLHLRPAGVRAAFVRSRERDRRRAALPANPGLPELMRAWRWIGEGYIPRRYSGRITVLTADEEGRAGAMRAAGWSKRTARIVFRSIPGNHLTCIADHITATAREIARALELTDAG